MISESDIGGNSPNPISLCDLPGNVLQLICQLLLHNLFQENPVNSLRDVLKLRSTCVYLCEIINDMVLFLKCRFANRWLLDDVKSKQGINLLSFLNFIKTKTNWRFFSCESSLRSGEEVNLQLLSQFESLFTNSLNEVTITVPKESYSTVNSVLKWLERVTVKRKASFDVTFYESVLILPNPNIVNKATFVTNRFIIGPFNSSFIPEKELRNLSFYANLRELNLPDSEIKLNDLELFPCLTSLTVTQLDPSNLTRVESPTFITALVILNQTVSHFELLPLVFKKCFPILEYLDLKIEGSASFVADFTCLPNSCSVLSISSDMLQNFKKFSSLKFLNLFYRVYTHESYYVFQYGSELQISVLKIMFCFGAPTQLLGLFETITCIIKRWKYLEVISVQLIRILTSGAQSVSLDFESFNNDVHNLFIGNQHFKCDEFIRQLDELRKLWIASGMQMLVFGQTVWTKKTTSPCLIKQIDRIDAFRWGRSWSIRPHDATVLLLDDLDEA